MTDTMETRIALHESRIATLEESQRDNAAMLKQILQQLAEIAAAIKFGHTPETCPKMREITASQDAAWRRIEAQDTRLTAMELKIAEASGSVNTGGSAIKYIAGVLGALLLAALSAWLGHVWK